LDSNKNAGPEKGIYCYIRNKKRTIKLHTGEKILPESWNKQTQRAIVPRLKNYESAMLLNSVLNEMEENLKRIIRKLKLRKITATFEDLKNDILNYYNAGESDIYSTYDKFIEVKQSELSESSIKKYRRNKIRLAEFEQDKSYKLTFDTINLEFYDMFMNYLRNEQDMQNNSAYKEISFLKAFLNWSLKRNYHDNRNFDRFEVKEEKTEVIFLDGKELSLIRNYDFSNDKKLERARDVFLFQCYTGTRYIDILNLKNKNIINNYWHLRTVKTKDVLRIPLLKDALQIIDKYKIGEEKPDHNPLPVISNQKMNVYVKELCKLAGIDTIIEVVRYQGKNRISKTKPKYNFIGTHSARRTFISYSLQNGVRAETVMKITGIRSPRTLQKYIGISEQAKIDEMKTAFDKLN